jgi:phage terminase small subunit
VAEVFAADTRTLSGDAALLYAGVKETSGGIEIRMHDQLKALENVARHLGLFKDQVEQSVPTTIEIVRLTP